MIGDTLVRDELGLANATRDWIMQRRKYLKKDVQDIDVSYFGKIM